MRFHVAYHSWKKKTAVLYKVLVCLVNGKIFKWKTLPSNSPLVARQTPCNEKKKRQQQVALKKQNRFDRLEPLTRQRKK